MKTCVYAFITFCLLFIFTWNVDARHGWGQSGGRTYANSFHSGSRHNFSVHRQTFNTQRRSTVHSNGKGISQQQRNKKTVNPVIDFIQNIIDGIIGLFE